MAKIKKITVSNLKAVTDYTADFNGCTALVTGRNNSGKTSFLRGLFDRVRGTKATEPLRTGTDQGFAEAELTTGERLRWEFNDKGKEKLIYTTERNIKTALSVELRNKFLPETFDVDEFLQAAPMAQRKTLQKLAGLDFTDIDARYDIAYKERAAANKSHSDQKVKFEQMEVAPVVQPVSVEILIAKRDVIKKELNDKYLLNKKANTTARQAWQTECDNVRKSVQQWNEQQANNRVDYNTVYDAAAILKAHSFISKDMDAFVEACKLDIKDDQNVSEFLPKEPEYIEELPNRDVLDAKDTAIQEANKTNVKAALHQTWLLEKTKLAELSTAATDANKKVTDIENERLDLIKTANMPEGFTFSDTGILYNSLPFTREQLSSSGIYIGALKLASLKLGEIRCLHFDASFLDKNNLQQIEVWANEQDLQLLIERPDFDAGEIEYQLLQS